MNDPLFLKPNIKLEPTIWKWYLWPYLIPPVTAAGNIVERHIKIMESYLAGPEIHIEACKNPTLVGGPFMNVPIEKSNLVKELLETTKKECSQLIILNQDIKDFDNILQREGTGYCLDNLYGQVPEGIKGLIELVYDLNNHPSIRLIEPLVYYKYYNNTCQAIVISETKSDQRPFVLSTPKIPDAEELEIKIPFSDIKLDLVYAAYYNATDVSALAEQLMIETNKLDLFKSFFHSLPPELSNSRKYNGNGVRIRYMGHACILLETKNVSILVDPIISYEFSNNTIERFTYNDLPDHIDYILLTHNHQDHILFETLLRLRHKIGSIIIPNSEQGSIADPSLRLILEKCGFKNIKPISELESLEIPDGVVTGLPFLGEHSDLNIKTKMAHHVKLLGKSFLMAADSNNLEPKLYEYIFDIIKNVDIVFVGMECDGAPLSWLYGPLLPSPIKRSQDHSRRLSGSHCEKAWKIIEQSNCKEAYVYAMGQEPWFGYILTLTYDENSLQIVESNKFVSKCKEKGIISERLFGKKEWIYE